MQNRVIQNPNYKTGVKILTRKQMQAGLPTYDLLLSKIKKIRKESLNVSRETLISETFDNLKYDNIFSILGGRGAGKTSVLLTLHNELQKTENNIILPLVMPELLDNEESIIGWLLSAMEYNLEQIENKIKEHGFQNKSQEYQQFCESHKLFERCVFNKNNGLRECFNQLKAAYYAKEYKSCRMSEMDFSTIKELVASGIDNSFSLINKFTKYWNMLINVYSKFLNEKSPSSEANTSENAPLIFIFIDDADLKPQIINELLFVIPKYLSHPNVIVVVSASQKTLTYAVKNHMYKSITQSTFNLPDIMNIEYNYNDNYIPYGRETTTKFHDLRYGKEYAKITKLADEVLRKLFPVSQRFYLKKYNKYEEKRLLQVFTNESPECKETKQLTSMLAEMLYDFKETIFTLHNSQKKELSEPTEETLEKKEESFQLAKKYKIYDSPKFGCELYISFLGQYPRDIMNVYFSIKDMLTSMTELLKNYQDNVDSHGRMPLPFVDNMYEIIIKFIGAAVSSNRNLSMFSRPVRDFVKAQHLHWQLYVDYAKVLEVFNDEKFIKGNQQDFSPFVEMMCLLNFVEQLIVLVMPQRRTTHGANEFNNLLRLCNIEVIKPVDDIDLLFRQYYLFNTMHLIPVFNLHSEEQRKSFLKGVNNLNLYLYLENTKENSKDKNKELKIYSRMEIKKYRKWYELLTRVFFWNNSLAGQLPKYKLNLLVFPYREFLDILYDELRTNYLIYLEKFFYFETPLELKKKFSSKIVSNMNNAIDDLENAIEDLTLSFNEIPKHQTDFFTITNSINEYPMVKIRVESFILKYTNELSFFRSDFLEELKNIENIVESTTRNSLKLKRWFQKFKNELHMHFTLVTDDKSYSDYKNACTKILGLYEEYIDYYTWVIKQNNYSSINHIKDDNKMLSSIINEVKAKEWSKIINED